MILRPVVPSSHPLSPIPFYTLVLLFVVPRVVLVLIPALVVVSVVRVVPTIIATLAIPAVHVSLSRSVAHLHALVVPVHPVPVIPAGMVARMRRRSICVPILPIPAVLPLTRGVSTTHLYSPQPTRSSSFRNRYSGSCQTARWNRKCCRTSTNSRHRGPASAPPCPA